MDLQEFVSSSITQIVDAIKKAQEQSKDSGAWISPAGLDLPQSLQTVEMEPDIHAYVHDVKFDIAVTVGTSQDASAGAKLQIFSASLGGGGSVEYNNAQVSRVKFSIPVVWPISVRPDREKLRLAERKRQTDRMYSPGSQFP